MKKNIILFAAALVAFAACEKPTPYEPGAQMDVNGPNVYFSNYYNSPSVVIASDATEFEVAVLRSNASGALSVPLKAECGYEGLFEFPASVEFADGQDSVGVTIKITEKFEMFKNYDVALSIPEEYTHAYAVQEAVPTLNMSVLQEDFVPYAKGLFLEFFWSGENWEAILEYSAIKEIYRIKNPWGPVGDGGSDLTFTWDQAETVKYGAGSYPTGIYHSSYGYITAVPQAATYGTIPEDEIGVEMEGFTFVFKWTVSAGSFGTYPNYYVITETL